MYAVKDHIAVYHKNCIPQLQMPFYKYLVFRT